MVLGYRLLTLYPSALSRQTEKTANICDTTSGFPTKWHLTNECRNSILMMHHYTDLGSTSDWSCCKDNVLHLIGSTDQMQVVMHNQYGISEPVPQTSFCRETSGGMLKSWLFAQATLNPLSLNIHIKILHTDIHTFS